MIELKECNSGCIRVVTLDMLINENENCVTEEQKFVLITNSLKVFELSMISVLESL